MTLVELFGRGTEDAIHDAATLHRGPGRDRVGPASNIREYTIADIAVWAWYGTLVQGRAYDAGEFLAVDTYETYGALPICQNSHDRHCGRSDGSSGGGGFGHFYAYAPTKIEYAIDRFAMEVKRQLDVLDRRWEAPSRASVPRPGG